MKFNALKITNDITKCFKYIRNLKKCIKQKKKKKAKVWKVSQE